MIHEGQKLGEFEILEQIGQGGMGAVYRARQTALRRLVAIKTLQPALAGDAEYVARFHNEAVAAAGLNHPNLVQVYSAGEADGLHYFAMEYVEGESAQARVKRKGRIEPGEAIAIAMNVATALDYGWRKAQLIHRDIKPDNIFLSGDGEVKLGDLGLAKSLSQSQGLTSPGASLGTPRYISPEQAQGKMDIDLRTDIYSLGCTLFHLLSGQPPYSGDSAIDVMMKHVSAPVPDLRSVWPACPPALAATVAKTMKKSPAARHQTYAELSAELRHAYDSLTAPAATTAWVAAQPKKRLVWMGVAAGVAIAVAALLHLAPWIKSAPAGTAKSPFAATNDAPFVNSLGMKFVPVPITGGPSDQQRVLFSVWDTRVQDCEVFAMETKREWPKADFEQGATHPAVNVSWEDATAFCTWLTERERKTRRRGALAPSVKQGAGAPLLLDDTDFVYRLPSDHEWSCAVGLGDREDAAKLPGEKSGNISDTFPWGAQWPPPENAGNYASEELQKIPVVKKLHSFKGVIAGYRDGYANTAPVGSYVANRLNLFDMGGNVWQWCGDWFEKERQNRVLRGASWTDGDPGLLWSSLRGRGTSTDRSNFIGFRCVLETAPPPAPAGR